MEGWSCRGMNSEGRGQPIRIGSPSDLDLGIGELRILLDPGNWRRMAKSIRLFHCYVSQRDRYAYGYSA